jgi:hypothetical protein
VMIYRAEKRRFSGNPTSPSNGEIFHVVTGPGAVPYVAAPNQEIAEYLASWMNVAYAQGKTVGTLKGHRAKATERRGKIPQAEVGNV